MTAKTRAGSSPGLRRPTVAPQSPVGFSLFVGDRLNRLYSALGISSQKRLHLLKRCALVVMLTWVPTAILAFQDGLVGGGMVATNFFADFAAYAQFLLAMPLFVIAEPIIDSSTRKVDKQLVSNGIIKSKDIRRLNDVHKQIKWLCRSYWSDLTCIALAYIMSLSILIPEFGPNPSATWHVRNYEHWRMLTAAGGWEFLIALPLLNYTWLRFVWKILLWIFYLGRVSRMRFDLHPTHSDLTAGVGFVSEAQGKFAILILAYGISNVAATIGYQIVIQHDDLRTLSIWGELVGFGIGAPLLFTLPLFMFTSQLYQSKRRALEIYHERISEASRRVESHWASDDRGGHLAGDEIREITELTTLGIMYAHVEKMRVVPFDLRSVAQLLGSSFGSIATLLPLLHFDEKITKIFEFLGKLLPSHGG